ncbi:hypothetical protein SESBI_36933 [Sesbania bispinosa]|nr:hypothetical protein SESBI_36933 [Sesbania bispinosa]
MSQQPKSLKAQNKFRPWVEGMVSFLPDRCCGNMIHDIPHRTLVEDHKLFQRKIDGAIDQYHHNSRGA